jgi:hypothetical protein
VALFDTSIYFHPFLMLFILFIRLSVGWAWQVFISTATSAVISTDNIDRKWLLVLVDLLNAAIVCYLGGSLIAYLGRSAAREKERNKKNKNVNGGSGRGGTPSLPSTQHSLNDPNSERRTNSDSSLETPLL